MQSIVRTGPSLGSQRLCGSRLSYSVVAAPTSAATATRQVTTMAKKKGVRIIVTMECTESRGEGLTPSRYTTQKVRALADGKKRKRRRRRAAVRAVCSETHTADAARLALVLLVPQGPPRAVDSSEQQRLAPEAGVLPKPPCCTARSRPWSRPLRFRLLSPCSPSPSLLRKQHTTTHPNTQNRRNDPERLELMKYNPNLRRYTLHREIK